MDRFVCMLWKGGKVHEGVDIRGVPPRGELWISLSENYYTKPTHQSHINIHINLQQLPSRANHQNNHLATIIPEHRCKLHRIGSRTPLSQKLHVNHHGFTNSLHRNHNSQDPSAPSIPIHRRLTSYWRRTRPTDIRQ